MEGDSTNATLLFSVDYLYYSNHSGPLDYGNASSPIPPSSRNDSLFRREMKVNMGVSDLSRDGDWNSFDWNGSQYPSGYSQMRIIVTAFFVTFIMVVIVVGNMLVCIAIATEKALKTVQNWFIASLAVSDFLVGLVIMPFSLAKELMGYWIFGNLWCEIHAALDVLLCTASINNLCLISLDRYWSVTQAVEYLKKRTPTRAVLMIFFVWLLSALISLPPLLGWKKEEKQESYPSCSLSEDVGYVVYSALGSFYIPAIVMVFVYIRIFSAARSRARRHVKKPRHTSEVTNDPHRDKSTTTTTCTSFSNPSPPDRRKEPDLFRFPDQSKLNGGKRDSAPHTPTLSNMPQIIIEASAETSLPSPTLFPTELPTPAHVEGIPEESLEDQDAEEDEDDDDEYSIPDKYDLPNVEISAVVSLSQDAELIPSTGDYVSPVSQTKPVVATVTEPRPLSPCPYTCVYQPPSEATSATSCPQKRVRTTFKPMFQSRSVSVRGYEEEEEEEEISELYQSTSSTIKKRSKLRGRLPIRSHGPLIATPSDAERHKRRIAKARERRATLILGLIMAAFILAWLPFFVLYVLGALCASCNIGPTGFATAFWLGYCNSALNPIIYTIFNRDFRRAFKKILLK